MNPSVRRLGRRPAADADAPSLLLTAARQLFASKGFGATSTREIAAAAGLNIGLISYYFGGKEGLYRACVEGVRDRNLRMASACLPPATSVADLEAKLKHFIAQWFAAAAADPYARKLLNRAIDDNGADAEHHELIKDVLLRPLATIAGFFAAARSAGFIDFPGDPLLLANILTGFITHQLQIDAVKEQLVGLTIKNAEHRRELIELFIRTFVGGIAAR